MGKYKTELKKIIRSSPSIVIIAFAGKYAEDRISKASFENIIRYHADQLRDKAIPFLFLLAPENEENRQSQFFNGAIEELCKLRSIPIRRNDKQMEANLIKQIREMTAQ